VVVVWLFIFWLMQAGAQLLFNCGAVYPDRKALFWVLGNIPGATSILFLIQLYKLMNPNLALALGGGGGFIAAQLAMVLVFRTNVTVLQYVAMLFIAAGMAMFSLCGKPA
jgi:hypothetical protein